ncbi:MAG: type II/IV secretion system protein [Rhodospirillales bacterium]|nr:type II/IV secretion system protein [Rhodospirillales bacterium]
MADRAVRAAGVAAGAPAREGFSGILLQRGAIGERDLARARAVAEASGEPLHLVLVRLGLVAEAAMASALAESLGLPLAGEADFPRRPILADRVAVSFLEACRIIPLSDGDSGVAVALADPLDSETLKALRMKFGKPVTAWVAVPGVLDRHLKRLYGRDDAAALEAKLPSEGWIAAADVETLRDLASDVPIVRAVNRMIADAVAERASDIHMEPYAGELRVRHRIDGVLRPVAPPPLAQYPGIVSRIKILANLDVVERRLPQDGRCKVHVQGRTIDIRVSCVPSLQGESLVLRILDKASAPLSLDRLGFDAAVSRGIDRLIAQDGGIVLVTGPTGSGKTTTLYAALQKVDTTGRKLVTVEDPVEYELPGITQIQVQPHIGLGFARVLRSVLRHDPDVLMVGEIRDRETAEIAVQAALTGHLVLSTLHTNDAASAIIRLTDMGVEPYLLTSALRGVLAQRLVRTLCDACRAPRTDVPDAVKAVHPAAPKLFDARGCERCGETGYFGRMAVAELLPVDDTIRAAILAGADSAVIAKHGRAGGMRTMTEDGLAKAAAGVTTVEEVLRVTGAL